MGPGRDGLLLRVGHVPDVHRGLLHRGLRGRRIRHRHRAGARGRGVLRDLCTWRTASAPPIATAPDRRYGARHGGLDLAPVRHRQGFVDRAPDLLPLRRRGRGALGRGLDARAGPVSRSAGLDDGRPHGGDADGLPARRLARRRDAGIRRLRRAWDHPRRGPCPVCRAHLARDRSARPGCRRSRHGASGGEQAMKTARDGGLRMDYGVHLPLIDFGGGPRSLRQLLDYARTAERLGFAALSANDHLLFSRPWLDGPTALSSVLAASGRMDLMTTVALPVVRGPVALAKSMAAIDILCAGRLIVGVGPGSSASDYEAVGLPFEER